jgi:hypothetical protein
MTRIRSAVGVEESLDHVAANESAAAGYEVSCHCGGEVRALLRRVNATDGS